MADSITIAPKRRWLRWLGFLFLALILLLAIAWFYLTSAAFLKGTILPKVSQAVGAEVTVADATIHPFSEVILRQLKVQPPGLDPLVTANEVRLRYRLRDILGGRINVDEVTLDAPTIQLVTRPDGKSNLDPLLEAGPKTSDTAPRPSGAPPPQIDIKKITLQNGTVRRVRQHGNGARDLTELTGLKITLDQLKNGATTTLGLSGNLALEQRPPGGTNADLRAALTGDFTLDLKPDLQPGSVKGAMKFGISQAGGALAELNTLAAMLDCEITPTEIKQVALRFQKSGIDLGVARVSGPFDSTRQEGKLVLELSNIDRNVLNLAAASAGLDFSSTVINSHNEIEITQQGKAAKCSGRVTVTKFAVTQAALTTPPMDVSLDYKATVDTAAKTFFSDTFQLAVQQNSRQVLFAMLSAPLTLNWGGSNVASSDAGLRATLERLNLADWKALLGDVSGTVDATLDVLAQRGGEQIGLKLSARATDLSGTFGSNQLVQAGLSLDTRASLGNFRTVALSELRAQLSQAGRPAATISASGQFDSKTGEADAQLEAQATLPTVLSILPQPGLDLASGTVSFNTKVLQKTAGGKTNVLLTGKAGLADFAMRSGSRSSPPVGATADFQVEQQNGKVLDLQQCRIALSPTARAKNELNLTGRIDTSDTNAITGRLKIAADTLDLTAYYDTFTGTTAPTGAAPAPAPTGAPPPAGGEKEPEPVKIPVKDFVAEATIERCLLRELDLSKLEARVRIDGSRVTVKPVSLAINRAPVQAALDFDLSVPGYRYDVALSADRVPVEPLANSFSPDYRGQAKGELIAGVQIQGAGVTGPSLQKNLAGTLDFAFTNANIQIAGPKAKLILLPIALALRLPELLNSPVNDLNTSVKLGGGKATLNRFSLRGDLFAAESAGDIALASVLTNSTINNLPVALSLKRSLAERAKLMPANTPTNAVYVKLPVFSTVGGTVGEPKVKNDLKVLAGLLASSVTSIPGLDGTKAGDALQKVGGFLSGNKAANTNQATNAPATNKPAFNPLDLFNRPKKQ